MSNSNTQAQELVQLLDLATTVELALRKHMPTDTPEAFVSVSVTAAVAATIEAYADLFTGEEISVLIGFYSTPLAAKLISVSQLVEARVGAAVADALAQVPR